MSSTDAPQSHDSADIPALGSALRTLWSEVRSSVGRQLGLSSILNLLAALTEGLGLLMLIPILALFGIADSAGQSGAMAGAGWLREWLAESPVLAGSQHAPGRVLAIFVGLIALRQSLQWARDWVNARLQLEFVDQMRIRVFQAVADAEWQFVSTLRHADLMQALNADVNRVGQLLRQLQQMAISGLLALVYLAGAMWLAADLVLLALLAGGLLSLLYRGTQRRSLIHGRTQLGRGRALLHALEQFLGGLKWAKGHALEQAHVRQFAELSEAARATQLEHQALQLSTRFWFQLGAAVVMAGFAYLAIKWRLPATELILLIVILARLLPMMASMMQSWQQIVHALPALTAVTGLEQRCARVAESVAEDGGKPVTGFSEALVLRNVVFRYPASEQGVRIDALRFPARSTLALVGPSGAGKSTLVDMIAGLLPAQHGTLLLDGQPLTGARRRAWRRRIAYVPQETFLLDASLRDNLAWAAPEASDQAMHDVLQRVSADFVSQLPEGLDTLLGPRGIRLSGGERQRVALARALLRSPDLLILDEATSALDSETEQRIQQTLAALHGELSVVVIAHRLSTVRHADQIAVLEGGELVESGSWDELVSRADGVFPRLLSASQERLVNQQREGEER